MHPNYGLVRTSTGVAELKSIPVPKLRDDYILVRTVAVALNPTDWTTLEARGDNGPLIGCDYSGIVEEVGPAVTKDFNKGDRIAGFAHGENDANPENGAFARYIAVKGDMQMHIPDRISFEEAASVGVGVASAGYALFKVLGLPLPPDGPAVAIKTGQQTVLIYGGSTATGSIAIQFAKLAGWKVATTSSPAHFGMLKERGRADLLYDYREPNIAARIRKETNDSITHVFDCVADETTAAICAGAMTSDTRTEKIYCSLLPVDSPRPDVRSEFFLGYSMSGESYIFEGDHYPAQPEDFAFASKLYSIADQLWKEAKWKAHPQRIENGGLSGIADGMKQMKDGKVRGVKLIYRVDETSWPSTSS